MAGYNEAMQKQDTAADCPVARTLSVIGSSWTCLVLRDLLLHGARRFQELQDSLCWHCADNLVGPSQDA